MTDKEVGRRLFPKETSKRLEELLSHLPFPRFLRRRPGIGLLLMRAAMALAIGSRPGSHYAEMSAAVLVLGGAWTRVAATFIALVEVWRAIVLSGGWVSALLATMAVTLMLAGPGSWSVDARFFGWRRIDIQTRRSGGSNRSS